MKIKGTSVSSKSGFMLHGFATVGRRGRSYKALLLQGIVRSGLTFQIVGCLNIKDAEL